MKLTALFLFSLFFSGSGVWADEVPPPLDALRDSYGGQVEIDTGVVRDVRGGESVSAEIHPGLPARRFQLVGDRDTNTIQKIEVYVPGQESPVQTLEANQGESPYRDSKYFKTVDIDFDGYQDIGLLVAWTAIGNESWRFWRFAPALGRFIPDKVISELPRPEFDPKTKTIRTFTKASACESSTITYAYKNGKLRFQKGERCNLTQDDPPICKCHPLTMLSK